VCCCSVLLQCVVAVCCSVLQSIEVCSVGTADAVRKSVLLQCIIAVCYYCVLQWVAVNVRGRERELNIENCSTKN